MIQSPNDSLGHVDPHRTTELAVAIVLLQMGSITQELLHSIIDFVQIVSYVTVMNLQPTALRERHWKNNFKQEAPAVQTPPLMLAL